MYSRDVKHTLVAMYQSSVSALTWKSAGST
jgi:hypothetical protein